MTHRSNGIVRGIEGVSAKIAETLRSRGNKARSTQVNYHCGTTQTGHQVVETDGRDA